MGMFRLETKKDIRMVGRAIRERWNVDKEAVTEALWEVIKSKDPELMLDAARLLLVADGIDAKREELKIKKDAAENEQRLRLLELAKRIPVKELAQLASSNGIGGSNAEGRTRSTPSADGEETSGST